METPSPKPEQDLYRLLVQEVRDYAIFMLDANGHVLTWNAGAERMKGYKAGEIIGRDFSVFYTPEDIAAGKPAERLRIAAEQGRVEDEGWRVRKDGSRFWANVVVTALRDSQGVLRGFGKVTRDMTDKRREEEAMRADLERRVEDRVGELSRLNASLAEAGRIKDEFLATLSHELRTPLTAIVGWVHMLREGDLSKAQSDKALEVISRNLSAQTRLVEDLLNISRIISGKLRIEPQRIYPAPIIREVIESLRPTTDAKEINMVVDLETALGPLRADPARFQQIVWNLLSNALKFTPSRGTITVSLKQVELNAVLSITDSGEGIAPEFLPHVFDRFSQADSSRSRKYGGLGIGLAFVRHLVELHGGTVAAESAGAGQGSTFRVALPIPADRPAAMSSDTDLARPNALEGTRILVIEDEQDTREMLAHALEQKGAHIREAASAAEALHILLNHHIDVLVSDIGMPGIDGYNLIHQVRAMKPPLRTIPAIALTGMSRDEDRLRAIRAGFDAHITKPIAISELVRTLASLRKVS